MVRLRLHAGIVLALLCALDARAEMIGINVLLNTEVDEDILAELDTYGQVLEVLPEISAVTLRAQEAELPEIQALSYVEAASRDGKVQLAEGLPIPDFAAGANQWTLDAIDVTDVETTRTVDYTGEGVYIGVIDSGLPHNWREYFPEDRIATEFAVAFGGGGGELGTISQQPEKWEHDTNGHGTWVTSVILGFHYSGPEDLPTPFNGVAPKATVIPVDGFGNNLDQWFSVLTRAILYLTDLKVSGALGEARLVINMSFGGDPGVEDPMQRAAIDYAIANGVVLVAAAGNSADAGMVFPGLYEPVISAAATGWVEEFPPDDPTVIAWILRDVAEDAAAEHFIAPFASRELADQDLDVAAPGFVVPVPWTADGRVDYNFVNGTSFAAPHVTGVAALMLEKNPTLTQTQIEEILEETALPLPPGCADVTLPGADPGDPATWGDHDNIYFFDATVCWESNATGHGLLQADAVLDATPLP